MSDTIEVGDSVTVEWGHSQCAVVGTVLGIPVATGDCWRIRAISGELYYFQQFDYIMRKDKP